MPTSARNKRILKLAKGYRGKGKNCIRIARRRVEKGLQYQYRDRKTRKRDFRRLWIQQLNAGAREHGLKYSHFICGLHQSNIELDRKVLADLAANEPYSFKGVVDIARKSYEETLLAGAPATTTTTEDDDEAQEATA
eukprot:g360.t1